MKTRSLALTLLVFTLGFANPPGFIVERSTFSPTARMAEAEFAQGRLSATAPDCGLCQDLWDEQAQKYYHRFGGVGALFQCQPGSGGCHLAEYWNPCSAHHYSGSQCQEEPGGALEDLVAAIEAGDASRVEGVLVRHAKWLAYNPDTRSATAVNCVGNVVGTVTLPAGVSIGLLGRALSHGEFQD